MNMQCNNKASYYVPHGYDYREVLVPCGRTDPHGGRAVCDRCASDPKTMRAVERQEAIIEADNRAAASAGFGEY